MYSLLLPGCYEVVIPYHCLVTWFIHFECCLWCGQSSKESLVGSISQDPVKLLHRCSNKIQQNSSAVEVWRTFWKVQSQLEIQPVVVDMWNNLSIIQPTFLQKITVLVGEPFTVKHLVDTLRAENKSQVTSMIFFSDTFLSVYCPKQSSRVIPT